MVLKLSLWEAHAAQVSGVMFHLSTLASILRIWELRLRKVKILALTYNSALKVFVKGDDGKEP